MKNTTDYLMGLGLIAAATDKALAPEEFLQMAKGAMQDSNPDKALEEMGKLAGRSAYRGETPTSLREIPEMVELLDDDDTEKEKADKKAGSVDEYITALNTGYSAMASNRSTQPTRAAVDRAMANRPFEGRTYQEGKAHYDRSLASAMALDSSGPELPARHFYEGVAYPVGKAAHDAYLEARNGRDASLENRVRQLKSFGFSDMGVAAELGIDLYEAKALICKSMGEGR